MAGNVAHYRLRRHGFELVRKPSDKIFWREPGTGRLLRHTVAVEQVVRAEEERLAEAGWQPVDREESRYWCNPESGRLYPREAAYDLVEGVGSKEDTVEEPYL